MFTASDMTGKAALITGASGDLGRAVALALASAGADLCIVDPDDAALAECATAIREQGVKVRVFATEVSGAENCRAAVAAAVDAFGRLDALCNVANVFAPAQAAAMEPADWEATLAVNLSAPFYLIQAALPHLLSSHGSVVSVASCAAFMAQPFTAAYTASKAGLVQMTKALAKEFLDQPVRFNCLAPGSMAVGSGNQSRIGKDVDMSRVQKLSPSRGMIAVEDVAAVVAFLASDAAEGFHGASLTMDNGISLG